MAYLPKSLRERVARQQERARAESLVARRPLEIAESEAAARELNDPELKIPWNVRVWAAWSWRMLVILALVAAMVLLLAELKHVVIPILLAVILAVLLSPAVSWLRRVLRLPRAIAAIVTVLLVLSFLGLLVSVAGRGLYTGFRDLADKAGAGLQSLLAWLANGPLAIDQAQIDTWLKQITTAIQDNSGVLANGALSVTSSIGNIAAGSAVVLFLTIFFLMDGRAIWIWCVRLMPMTWRGAVHEASIRGWVTLRGYTRSTILVALIDAIGIGVGAAILGVPLALPLGLLVFVGSFIPIVGAFLTGTVAVLVALVDKGVVTALVMFGIVLAVQQIEGHILQPLITGSSVSLHPVAVVIGVAGGTYVAGITGAVFTVPVMAFINTVALYLSGHDKFPRLATALDRPGGAPGTLDEQIHASYGYSTVVGVDDGEADLAADLPPRGPGAATEPSEPG